MIKITNKHIDLKTTSLLVKYLILDDNSIITSYISTKEEDDYIPLEHGFQPNRHNVIDFKDRNISYSTIGKLGSSKGDFRTVGFILENLQGETIYPNFLFKEAKKLDTLPSYFYDEEDTKYLLHPLHLIKEREILEITLYDEELNIYLKKINVIYPSLDIILECHRIESMSEDSLYIKKFSSLELNFTKNGLYPNSYISLCGTHMNERNVSINRINYGKQSIYSYRGATSHFFSNSVILANEVVGNSITDISYEDYITVSFLYSGSFEIDIDKDYYGLERLLVSLDSRNNKFLLTKNSSITSPFTLIHYNKDLKEINNTLRNFFVKELQIVDFLEKKNPIVFNNWEATFFDITEEKIKDFIDKAFVLGLDLFVLDDGWFLKRNDDNSSLGDYIVDPEKFPNGLEEISNYCKSNNLKFGLWVEPEMISLDSELYRKHPEYLMRNSKQDPFSGRGQFVLDLLNPEVYNYVRDNILLLIEKYNLFYLKWDMNRNQTDFYSPYLEKINSPKQSAVEYYFNLAYNKLIDEIFTKGHVRIEGCSGGGGRLDFNQLAYSPTIWTSDNTDPLDRFKILSGTSLIYHPQFLSSHISKSNFHLQGEDYPLDYRFAASLTGSFGLEFSLDDLDPTNDECFVKLKRLNNIISFYKEVEELTRVGNFRLEKSYFKLNRYLNENKDTLRNEDIYFTYKLKDEYLLVWASLDKTNKKTIKLTLPNEKNTIFKARIFALDKIKEQQIELDSKGSFRFKLNDKSENYKCLIVKLEKIK